jgi:hypothetical protein
MISTTTRDDAVVAFISRLLARTSADTLTWTSGTSNHHDVYTTVSDSIKYQVHDGAKPSISIIKSLDGEEMISFDIPNRGLSADLCGAIRHYIEVRRVVHETAMLNSLLPDAPSISSVQFAPREIVAVKDTRDTEWMLMYYLETTAEGTIICANGIQELSDWDLIKPISDLTSDEIAIMRKYDSDDAPLMAALIQLKNK